MCVLKLLAQEGGGPFDILRAETRRAPSRPLGGEPDAFSVCFPACSRVDPTVRMLDASRRSSEPVFSPRAA